MAKVFEFHEITSADLVVDAIYESSPDGQLSGEPMAKLLPGSGNMGGFRVCGRGKKKNWVILFTTGEDRDWPDTLNINTGQFVYYGDNKTPGHELHETNAGGNKVLRHAFERLHAEHQPRIGIAPFFVFKKHPTANGPRSVQFKGVAVPGFPGLSATEDLVAVWKATNGQRFQNYRAIFTILDVSIVNRAWLKDLSVGKQLSENTPVAWHEWMMNGKYNPLYAESTTNIRTIDQQTPDTPLKIRNLEKSLVAFQGHPNRIRTLCCTYLPDDRPTGHHR